MFWLPTRVNRHKKKKRYHKLDNSSQPWSSNKTFQKLSELNNQKHQNLLKRWAVIGESGWPWISLKEVRSLSNGQSIIFSATATHSSSSTSSTPKAVNPEIFSGPPLDHVSFYFYSTLIINSNNFCGILIFEFWLWCGVMWVKHWFRCRSFVRRMWCITMRWILMPRCWTCLTPLLSRNRFLLFNFTNWFLC